MSSEQTESIICEASNLNIPILAFTDSNANISNITYSVPINTYNHCSIWFFFSILTKLINRLSLKTY